MSNIPPPEGQSFQTPAGMAPMPITAQMVGPPNWPPRRRGWGRIFVFFLLLALFVSVMLNLALGLSGLVAGDNGVRVQEKYVSHAHVAPDKVVVLPIEGVILESADGFVKRAIDRATEDKSVKAIVLRVDSPGGSVSGSDFIYHHLKDLARTRKIPIVVSMGGIAASGGYYVSMAVGHEPDVIFDEPTGFTGSIGVIIPSYNVAGLMDQYKVVDNSICSNPLKELGSPTKEMTKEARKILQDIVDESFAGFKQIVRSGREKFEKDPAALDKLATGQIYTAEQALKNGLVDKLGFLEDAVNRAIELAKLDEKNVMVVKYAPETSLLSLLSGAESHTSAAQFDLKTVLSAATPKAYYIVSWFPALAAAVK